MINTKQLLNNFWETKSRIVDDYVENYHTCYRDVMDDYTIEVKIKQQIHDEPFIQVIISDCNGVQTFYLRDIIEAINCVVNNISINALV